MDSPNRVGFLRVTFRALSRGQKCHKNAGFLRVSLNEFCAVKGAFFMPSRFVYCIYLNDIIYIIKGGANDESKQRKYRWIS